METFWLLVTISICAGLRIPATSDKHDTILVAPMQPPVWQAFKQNKIESFQRNLKNSLKDTYSRCSLDTKSASAQQQQFLNGPFKEGIKKVTSSSSGALRELQEKVLHIRKVTGKTKNMSDVTPQSLRNYIYQQPLNKPNEDVMKCSSICPREEEFLPCLCDPCSRYINCSAITSFNQLQELFHSVSFPIQSYNKFYLSHPKFTSQNQSTLPDNLFGNISFVEIMIENTMMEHIMDNTFSGSMNTLNRIELQSNFKLTHFPFNQMKNFNNLTILIIEGSSLTSVPVLGQVPSLTYVFLNHNKISSIAPMAFADLTKLQVIDMGLNLLEQIEAHTLHFSAEDVLVYTHQNYITAINEKAFSGNQPVHVDLTSNCLTCLEETVFTPILDTIIDNKYDSFVTAEDNPLQCQNILWLLQNPEYLLYFFLPDPNCSL